MSSSHAREHAHEAEHEQEHTPEEIHPGHGHSHDLSKRQTCPQGKTYYVCAIGPFKGCCSTGLCADFPHDPGWKPSLATATEYVTETQTAIGSYTTTVTMTLSPSHVAATSTLGVSGETGSTSTSASDTSSVSEVSALIPTPTHPSTLSASHTTGLPHISSSSPFLSIPLATSDPSPHPTSPQGGTIAGITLGLAGGIAFLILLCCFCVRRRRKNAVEDEGLKQALKEAAAVQVERNKALRALESRRTGVGSEGAWAASPRFSTSFVGRREV